MSDGKGLTVTVRVEPENIVEKALDEVLYKGHTLREWVDFLDGNAVDGAYMCDPEKAEGCRKTGCYINGGECYRTTVKAWSLDPEHKNAPSSCSQ